MSTVDPAAESGALVTIPWWRNVAERAIRQALQVAAPILAVIVGSGNGLDWRGAIGAVVVAVVLSVVKSAAGARADADSPLAVQLLDRAVSALAFTLLSFLPIAWADWATVDWGKAFGAAVAAGVLSLVQFYLSPPAFATPKQSNQALAA